MGDRRRTGTDRALGAAYRIALIYSAVFAIAVLALGSVAYGVANAAFGHQQDTALATEASELVRDYDLEGMAELRRDIARREVGRAANVFGYALLDGSGRRMAGALSTATLAPGWHDIDINPPDRKRDAGRALAIRLRTGETLVVALDTDTLERFDRIILELFAGGFVAVTGISVVGALVLAHYLRTKLERIGGTAAAIAGGQLERRVPVRQRRDEFDRLGAAINAMLDRIATLMENLRQVSTDLAHDLRTPLSQLRAGLEAALDGPDDPRHLRAAIERALGHGDELLALFTAILRIAEVERGDSRATFIPLDLAEIAADLAESYAPAVADGGRSLRLDAPVPVRILGYRALLIQALANLIDNAQLHTPVGTAIIVAADARDGFGRLTVTDDGPGVPIEDRERITQRFVRLERSRTTPGHGLGLNMVAAVARAHDGSLAISDASPGLRASIVVPIA